MDEEALNGAIGTTVDFSFTERDAADTQWLIPESGRYTVKLDGKGGGEVMVRADEVEEEEEDWTAGAGGGGSGGAGGKANAMGKGKGKGTGKGKGKGKK